MRIWEGMEILYRYGGEAVLGKSWHDRDCVLPDDKLYFVTEGAILIRYGTRTVRVEAGEMILIPGACRHSYEAEGTARKHWMHFSLRLGGRDFCEQYLLAEKITVKDPARVTEMFLTANRQKNGSFADKVRSDAAIMELVALYAEEGGVRENAAARGGIAEAIARIEQDERGEETLSSLAAAAHLSRTHFGRCFREQTGMSPMKYATVLRVERAKALLQNTALPVSEIMAQTGFLDASYFSRVFKSVTGYSPRAFRTVFLRGKNS